MRARHIVLALALSLPGTAHAQYLGGNYGYGGNNGGYGYGGEQSGGYGYGYGTNQGMRGGYGYSPQIGSGYGYGNQNGSGYGSGYGTAQQVIGGGFNGGLPYNAYGGSNGSSGQPRAGEDVMSLGRARQDSNAPSVNLPGAIGTSPAVAEKRNPKGQRIEGVAKVIDGNTLVVGADVVVINGADAPENDQTCTNPQGLEWRCGQRAKNHLVGMVEGKRIVCTGMSLSGQAVVASCKLGMTDIGKAMVTDGYAYSPKAVAPAYVADESAARADHRGVWSGTGSSPWEFRSKN